MKPTEEQEEILDILYEEDGDVRINAYAGTGKCLGKDTPILMYDGRILPVQDVKVGDSLMGPDSLPRKVLSTCTGKETLYKIIPVKGESWICNESHILSLKGTNNYQKNTIRDISVKDFIVETEDLFNKSGRRDKNWKLYRTGVDFPVSEDPKLDPYYVGLYLGDGSEKYIPVNYLRSSKENRLKVLAGLLDSDGNLSSPSTYEITTKFSKLRDDILYLCRSLGFAAYCSNKYVKLPQWDESRVYFRISISGNVDEIPCILPRKKASKRKQIKDVLKTGFSLECIGVGDYYGFEIDGDKRFLLGDFTVTHNTTTLKMIVQDNPDKKFLYLAFNKAVADEAKKKFPDNCFVSTVHGLAFRNFVPTLDNRKFHSKLGKFWKTKDYIRHFSIESYKGALPPGEDLFIFASDIKNLVSKFKNSDSAQITEDMANFGCFRNLRYTKALKKIAVEVANKIWEAEMDMDSPVPIDHNTYLKMWELSEPHIGGYDIVLFDEAQDANPVMLSVIEKMQNIRKVYVGDTHQAIYGWNGAVNAMALVDVEHDCYLTKSWRFGPVIADEANKILRLLAEDPLPLAGNDAVKSEKGSIPDEAQYTVIFRTNGAMASYAVEKILLEEKVYVEGGVKELCNDLMALYCLRAGEFFGSKSRYKPYKYFPEVLEESKVDIAIRRDLMFIDKYGENTPEILEMLKDEVLTKRSIKKANCLLTTAHKSKGLEFDYVILWDDFKVLAEDSKEDKQASNGKWFSPEELNLLYVSVTRAKKVLKTSDAYEAFIKDLTERIL